MSSELLTEVEKFVESLETTQERMLGLFRDKLVALRGAKAERLQELSGTEVELGRKLQLLVAYRHRLLQRAEAEGHAVSTLTEFVDRCEGDVRGRLVKRVRRCESRSHELRREGWVHWIVAQRVCGQYAELLEFIANRGEKSPTYGRQSPNESSGGALLDASI